MSPCVWCHPSPWKSGKQNPLCPWPGPLTEVFVTHSGWEALTRGVAGTQGQHVLLGPGTGGRCREEGLCFLHSRVPPPPLYSPSPSSFSTAYFLSLLWPLSCRDGTLTETSGDAAWPSVSCLRAPWAHDESLAVHAIRERDGKSWPSALQKQRRVTANRELVCACMCVCFLSYQ